MGHQRTYYIIATVIATLGCVVSTILTVRLCLAVSGRHADYVTIAIGLLFEMAKYSMAMDGIKRLHSGRIVGGAALLCTSVATIIFSLAASLGYLVKLDEGAQNRAANIGVQRRELTTELRHIDAEIETRMENARRDQQASYRSRAIQTIGSIDRLRRDRREVANELASLGGGGGGTEVVFASIASLSPRPMSPTEVRHGLYALLAALIEAISICALYMRQSYAAPSAVVSDAHSPRTASEQRPRRVRIPSAAKVARAPRKDVGDGGAKYIALVTGLRTGSIAPSCRQVQRQLGVGQDRALGMLGKAVDDGILHRDSRGRFRIRGAA